MSLLLSNVYLNTQVTISVILTSGVFIVPTCFIYIYHISIDCWWGGEEKRQQVQHDCTYSNICIITSSILTDKRVGEKNSLIFIFSRVTDGRRRARHTTWPLGVPCLRNLYIRIIYTWLFFYQYRFIIKPLPSSLFVDRIFSEILETIIKAPRRWSIVSIVVL